MTFEEYVIARGPALVRLARLLTGDDHRAEDLTQDVLARAYPRWARICRADHPDLYLRRMLVNARNSWWRRRVNRELSLPAVDDRALPGDPGADAADRDAMWRLISALPERQRAVLVLRFYEDLDDTAIATILGCSPVTVRTHAMRALSTLRDRVGHAGWPVPEPVLHERGRG
ncbi:SigE family RNA polymerase sigma factor [Micromonospora sp. NPDC049679]|uniref:SigE family RNA polymerase sigma factor n=1 Tax=Micromonospora sp. NPDC049679 TaxID=3155920 RepID=UPI0033C973FA